MTDITRICRITGKQFVVTEADQVFYDKISPVINGVKYSIPVPTLCPEERQRQRMSYRNLRHLYHRKCDFSGKEIISNLPADSPHTVYHADIWWSDKWNPLKYGRDFDFSRPFFEQWYELFIEVPLLHHFVTFSENCEYINGAAHCKNCYLCFNMDYCEDSYYCYSAKYSNNCIDCLSVDQCQWCYECIDCNGCHSLLYSQRSINCSDSAFLFDCRRCRDCIGCVNLIDKQYCIFNQQYTKEDYKRMKKDLLSSENVHDTGMKAHELSMQLPKKHYFGHSNENFSGDNIRNIKNSYFCFDSSDLENCKYCSYFFNASNCMDVYVYGDNSQWIYSCQAVGTQCSNNSFCNYTWNSSSFNLYSFLMVGTNNCFGCCGLKKKQYCIFNKQYTKEEYEKLVPRIIEHMKSTVEWGEFFPIRFSPYGYNETSAYDEMPISKQEVLLRGFPWRDKKEGAKYQGSSYQIPLNITDVQDDITQAILQCEITGKPYKVLKQELNFYRQMDISIPRICPEKRYENRLNLRNPRNLWLRQCAKTGVDISTSFAPDRPEIIYSEEAYNDYRYNEIT